MPRTKWKDMARYSIPMPDRALARAFSNQIRPWSAEIRAAIHGSRTLANVRDTLLPRLFSGEVTVRGSGPSED